MKSKAYEQFAGLCAILAGLAGFLYSIAFVVISRSAPLPGGLLSGLFLLLSGLLAGAALLGVYRRLREVEAGFATWGFILGFAGTLGSVIHGGYDLANTINLPATIPANLADLPSQIDPRGLLTFGLAGISLFVLSWLMGRGGGFPSGLSILGYVLAVLLVVIYLGRLIVLQAGSPLILLPAALAGFIVNPAWYIWLGLSLRSAPAAAGQRA